MKIKIAAFKYLAVLVFTLATLNSCQKSTDPEGPSGGDINGGDNNSAAKIIDIKGNGDRAIYLTNTGDVYTVSILSSANGSTLVKSKVRGLKDIVKIACGPYSTVQSVSVGNALDKDGRLFVFSINVLTGTADSAVAFAKQSSFTSKIVDIAVGGNSYSYALALDQNKNVWAWGHNGFYQLGNNGTNYIQETPAVINGMPNDISAISAGSTGALALLSGGTVYNWGTIGAIGGAGEYKTPQVVSAAGAASLISAGDQYYLSKKNDGTVYVWGHLKAGIVPGIPNPSVLAAGAELYFNPMFVTSDGTLMKTSFSMATGEANNAEIVSELSAYKFSYLSVGRRAFYVTKDGKILVQLSYQTTPLILNNPLQ